MRYQVIDYQIHFRETSAYPEFRGGRLCVKKIIGDYRFMWVAKVIKWLNECPEFPGIMPYYISHDVKIEAI